MKIAKPIKLLEVPNKWLHLCVFIQRSLSKWCIYWVCGGCHNFSGLNECSLNVLPVIAVPEPPIITLQVLSHSSLFVSWHTPPGARNTATEFRVTYAPEAGPPSSALNISVEDSPHSVTLTNLGLRSFHLWCYHTKFHCPDVISCILLPEPSTWYEISVTAINSFGESAASVDWICTLPSEGKKTCFNISRIRKLLYVCLELNSDWALFCSWAGSEFHPGTSSAGSGGICP